ncbi:MAG: tRNA glutamyl-Q(34) synthetase GluQRS [Fimbriiglobus sp.]
MASHTVGRLAPSPTGAQHVGNARTYLAAWLAARSAGGRILLRIEDIDTIRLKRGAAEQALVDLRWLGLDWDGEPAFQSARLPAHIAALEELKRQDLVFPCACTRGDIAAAASAPHAEHEGPAYPGTCAHRSARDADRLDVPFAWRFRAAAFPDYDDLVRGPTRVDAALVGGDFVVWRADGGPAYQLAVVVDDSDTGVTQVIRGDDLVPSTPRQLLLYRAIGKAPPSFGHLPLVVGPDGRRLAKRHGDTRLSMLRKAGVSAESLVGLLAWSCGWLDDPRPITPTELLPRFRLATIPPRPFVLTPELLAAIGYLTG